MSQLLGTITALLLPNVCDVLTSLLQQTRWLIVTETRYTDVRDGTLRTRIHHSQWTVGKLSLRYIKFEDYSGSSIISWVI